jgi:hypothetical protein
MAPFGAGNPAFVFATQNLIAIDSSPIGKTGEHLQVLVKDEHEETRRIIWWQGAQEFVPAGRFDLAYSLRSSNFRGQAEVQVEWIHARPVSEEVIEFVETRKYKNIVDLREVPHPEDRLKEYMHDDILLWDEMNNHPGYSVNRNQLKKAKTLIVWNPPPGRNELTQVLRTVQPSEIILFAVPGGIDTPSEFLKKLTGMVRFALRTKSGQIDLNALAGALNQRSTAVEAGLRWLSARGFIRIVMETSNIFEIAEGGVPDEDKVIVMETALRNILRETSAFRSFYAHSNLREVLNPE